MSNNEIKNMPTLYGGKLNPEFNANDFFVKKGYVTFKDLLSYANLYQVNIFTNLNQFTYITVSAINGITEQTLSYLKNVSSDIQQQFQSLYFLLSGYKYDENTNITTIENDTFLNSLTTPNNITVGGKSILQNIISHKINSFDIESNLINTNKLNVAQLNINNIPFQDIGIYIYFTVKIQSYGQYTSTIMNIPIFKSILPETIGITQGNDNYFSCNIVIKPKYRIDFVDNYSNVLHSFTNNTTEVIYFQSINFNGILYKINIYYNNILII